MSGPTASALFDMARKAHIAGRQEEALRLYAQLANNFPNSPEARASVKFVRELSPDDGLLGGSPRIITSTTHFVPNREVERIIGVVSAECAYGMNIFRDLFSSVRDTWGGRAKSIETVLRDAKNTALADLCSKALDLNADAIIGIRFDFGEISGGGKAGMFFVVVTGTAVVLKSISTV